MKFSIPKLALGAIPTGYKILGAAVLSIAAVTGCFLAVSNAYNGIYDRGYTAGSAAIEKALLKRLLESERAQAEAQRKRAESDKKFRHLYTQYELLASQEPEVVIKYVRQDPQFAASKRPAALHDLRVRELRDLQEAARTH